MIPGVFAVFAFTPRRDGELLCPPERFGGGGSVGSHQER